MRRRHDERLAALLQDAGRAAEFPATPPLAAKVRARIETDPAPSAEIRLPRTRPPVARPVLATVAAAGVALAVTLSVSVTARRAVADLLGVAGIHITFDAEAPVEPAPASRIPLGDAVSEEIASERAGLPVLVPDAVPGTPAFYYDGSIGEGGMVSVVYPGDATTFADVDLLISQFVASVPEEYVKKLLSLGSDVEYTSVGSSEAFWIGGEPHLFFYEEADGTVRQETARLAGNVLLWAADGVTYRVEGAGSLREALRIGRSLR